MERAEVWGDHDYRILIALRARSETGFGQQSGIFSDEGDKNGVRRFESLKIPNRFGRYYKT
jgi:hypothetical protein